jgi:hypothetical protein
VVDAGVPPIALVDWEDGETLVGASGLVRPEPLATRRGATVLSTTRRTGHLAWRRQNRCMCC